MYSDERHGPAMNDTPTYIPDVGESLQGLFRAQQMRLILDKDKPGKRPRSVGNVVSTLHKMCMEITGAFEGTDGFASISGNFDGAGLSLGIHQQCLGPGSLQPLLREMLSEHRDVMEKCFPPDQLAELEGMLKKPKAQQLVWANSISWGKNNYSVQSDWKKPLQIMALTSEYVALQIRAARAIFERALKTCEDWKLTTQRAVAFAYDTCTQQGSISPKHKPSIEALLHAKTIKLGRPLAEVEKMLCMAQGRTTFSNPRWQADVLGRRYAIILGCSRPFEWRGNQYSGKVHGVDRNIDKEFGLSDAPWKEAPVRTQQDTPGRCPACGKKI